MPFCFDEFYSGAPPTKLLGFLQFGLDGLKSVHFLFALEQVLRQSREKKRF